MDIPQARLRGKCAWWPASPHILATSAPPPAPSRRWAETFASSHLKSGYRTTEEVVAYATSSVDVRSRPPACTTRSTALDGRPSAQALTGYDREFGPPMSPLRPAAERSVAWLDEMEGDIAFGLGTELKAA